MIDKSIKDYEHLYWITLIALGLFIFSAGMWSIKRHECKVLELENKYLRQQIENQN